MSKESLENVNSFKSQSFFTTAVSRLQARGKAHGRSKRLTLSLFKKGQTQYVSKRFGRQPPHCRKNAPVWPSTRRHCLKQEFLKGGEGGSFEEWEASATQLNHRWSTVVFDTSKTMTSHTLSWLDAPVERTNVDSSKKYRLAVPILSSPRLLLKTNSNLPCQEFTEKYILLYISPERYTRCFYVYQCAR